MASMSPLRPRLRWPVCTMSPIGTPQGFQQVTKVTAYTPAEALDVARVKIDGVTFLSVIHQYWLDLRDRSDQDET